MKKFRGVFDAVLDAKGRIVLPAPLRKLLPENFDGCFVINEGLDDCLTVYMKETWDPIADRIDEMPDLDPIVREYKRVANSAIDVEIDNSDRLLIPKMLVEFANIKKDIIVQGMGKCFELWDKDTYNNNKKKTVANYSENAQTVLKTYGDPYKEKSND